MRCPECLKELPRRAAFCTACGHRLKADGRAQPARTQIGGPARRSPKGGLPAGAIFVALAAMGAAFFLFFDLAEKDEVELPAASESIPGPQVVAPEALDEPAELPEPDTPGVRPPSPRGNPGSWVTVSDYPVMSLRNEEQGITDFRLDIATNGAVIRCIVTKGSGYERLDSAACDALARRARFRPAQDASGNAVEGRYESSIRWEIPQ